MGFCSWELKTGISQGLLLETDQNYNCCFEGSGSFYSCSYVSRDAKRLLSGGTLYATQDETWQGPTRRACWYVWTNARYSHHSSDGMVVALPCWTRTKAVICPLAAPGSGIGTGPGVIQDRFSPTMGRHRSNQLFNGHGGHLMPSAQSQFGDLGKSFLKSQVRKMFTRWLQLV